MQTTKSQIKNEQNWNTNNNASSTMQLLKNNSLRQKQIAAN